MPYVSKPRIFPQQDTPSWSPDFKAEFSDIQLEFDAKENIAFIFAAKRTASGSRIVRRSPYIAFHFQPYMETSGPDMLSIERVFNVSRFTTAEMLSETEFRMNGTFAGTGAGAGVFQQQLVWKVSPGSDSDPNTLNNIKFSLYLQSILYSGVLCFFSDPGRLGKDWVQTLVFLVFGSGP